MEETSSAAQLDNTVLQFNTYEDFLQSQISALDLYYLEVSLNNGLLNIQTFKLGSENPYTPTTKFVFLCF